MLNQVFALQLTSTVSNGSHCQLTHHRATSNVNAAGNLEEMNINDEPRWCSILNTHKTSKVLQPAFLSTELRHQVSTFPFHNLSAKFTFFSGEVVQGWVVGITNESYVLPEIV
jgi:hypothetical protein